MLRLVPLVAALLASHGSVVAGPTDSGATLSARDDRHGNLCLEAFDPAGSSSEDCERPGLTLRSFSASGSSSRRRALFYGTTAPEVAAAELVFPGGRRVRAATVAGERYHGRFAGKIRFFFAETRLRGRGLQQPLYARLFGSQGELLAVVRQSYDGARVGPKVTLARGRVDGVPWSLIAFQRRELGPLPGKEDRLVTGTCVGFKTNEHELFHGSRAESCSNPDDPDIRLDASADTGCEPIGIATIGFASPDTRRLVAVLGDGRRRPVPLLSLPHRFGGGRVFALALDKRTAVRRLVEIDADGHHRVVLSGVAPGMTSCPNPGGGGILFSYFSLPEPPRSGPVAFQVTDRGVLICPSLVGPPRTATCTYPPLEDSDGVVLTHRVAGATAVAGVMPVQAAKVVLKLDGDERVRLDTSLSGPYTGQYAGRLRFFATLLPGHRRVEAVRSIDSQGRSLVLRPGQDIQPLDRRPVTLMRLAGGWRLGGSTYTYEDEQEPCLQLTAKRFSTSPYSCGDVGFFFGFLDYGVIVPCRPRETLLWGQLPPKARTVSAETTVGTIPGRVVSLRPHLHLAGRAFVVVVPAGARPTALLLNGARKPSLPIRMPSAAQQCGWTNGLFFKL